MARPPVCARCGGPLPEYAGTGRPSRYCRTACRKAAYRARASRQGRSTRSEWWTPVGVRSSMTGRVTLGLDAAACAESTLVADSWLGPTHEDPARRDALAFDNWAELTPSGTSVWVNPPYTPVATLRAFLERAVATAAAGREVWALVPAATGSSWFQDLVVGAGGVPEFLRGRLTFTGPHSTGGQAPWPSAIVVYPAAAD